MIDPKSIRENMERRLRDATSDYHICSESWISECSGRGQKGRRGITTTSQVKGRIKGVSKSSKPAPPILTQGYVVCTNAHNASVLYKPRIITAGYDTHIACPDMMTSAQCFQL
eukprot:GHVR01192029.1.p1 GENE.GHVR01192029.1~~GHVR01192029.1.p1  ORF type:complete len:113 (+),score=1.79 GHVR01192029.1:197-535(+)